MSSSLSCAYEVGFVRLSVNCELPLANFAVGMNRYSRNCDQNRHRWSTKRA
jgi:hypothetical protein